MYNRQQVKAAAKESLNKNFGVVLGTLFVAGIIVAIASYVAGASIIIGGVIATGVAIVMLNVVRGNAVKFTDMFKGFNNFGPTCLAGILTSLYTFLWSLLFVIPGIVKSYSYSMTYYILADHPEMSANDAITASRYMMNGHKADLFVLQLSFIGWYFLSIITFGLAMFYAAPYMAVANAKFYDAIKGDYVIETPAEASVANEEV